MQAAKTQVPEDLTTHLYRQMKQMIWDNSLTPGTKIKQEHLAQSLGVSRTPLIKVLQRLTTERLIEYIPRRGYYVKKLTLDEMMEIFAVRQVVEGVAARAVAEKATDDEIQELKDYFSPFGAQWTEKKKKAYRTADQQFHARMFDIAGNGLLTQINEMFNIYRFSYQKGLMRHPGETLSEHREILAALEKRDGLACQLLAMTHIEKSRKNISQVFANRETIDGEVEW